MAATTKGGRPKTRANADPDHNRSFIVYCYKTYGGRTEIRLVHRKQDTGSTKWKLTGDAEIIKSSTAAADRVRAILAEWDSKPSSR